MKQNLKRDIKEHQQLVAILREKQKIEKKFLKDRQNLINKISKMRKGRKK